MHVQLPLHSHVEVKRCRRQVNSQIPRSEWGSQPAAGAWLELSAQGLGSGDVLGTVVVAGAAALVAGAVEESIPAPMPANSDANGFAALPPTAELAASFAVASSKGSCVHTA